MEISKFDEVEDLESSIFAIDDPRDGEYQFSLVIAGPTHPNTRRYAESEGRSLAHQGKQLGTIQKAIDARTAVNLTDTEISVARNVKGLLARTLDWKDVTSSGAPIPYDAKQMQTWYEDKAWLRDAVFSFLSDSRNFVRGSSTNSSSTPSTSSS